MVIDVIELLAELGVDKDSNEVVKAVGGCAAITFYYFLRVGGYTVKIQRNKIKQTMQFKLENAMFFRQDSKDRLRQLPINALDEDIFLQMEKL